MVVIMSSDVGNEWLKKENTDRPTDRPKDAQVHNHIHLLI